MKYTAVVIRILFLALFTFLILNGKMMLWLALFAASLLAALIFGRLFCGYVCPMNTLMIPTEGLSKKLGLQTKKSPKWLHSGKFTWFALAGSVIVMLLTQKLLHKNIPIVLIWLVVSVLVTLRYKPAVFHNLICPFGALQKTFGKFAILSKKVDEKKCTGCRLCEETCPTGAIAVEKEDKIAAIQPFLCLQCDNCQQVCPEGAISYLKIK